MPHKLRDPYRHKFDPAKFKITNWSEYNEALKNRGCITIWFTPELAKQWYHKPQATKSQGRQKTYSNLAIETMQVISTVYDQRLRQTEGMVVSIVELMNLNITVPDFSTLARRKPDLRIENLSGILDSDEIINIIIDSTGLKIVGPGEWHETKHNLKKRKSWRKLHIAIDKKSQKILSSELTTHEVGDPTPVPELLEEIQQSINETFYDAGYDNDSVYKATAAKGATAIIQPHKNAVLSEHYREALTRRDEILLDRAEYGARKWQEISGYNFRALVETAMYRYKKIIGPGLHSRKIENQKVDSKIACVILNKMVDLGMPVSEKIKKAS